MAQVIQSPPRPSCSLHSPLPPLHLHALCIPVERRAPPPGAFDDGVVEVHPQYRVRACSAPLLQAPGASHSGYEDHFQADAFHYMHHRYFECNYAGFNAAFLDVMFDTFVERFNEADRGKGGAKARLDAKSNLLVPPTMEFLSYLALAVGCLAAWAYAAVGSNYGTLVVSPAVAQAVSFAAGFGPVLVAVAVSKVFRGSGGTSLSDPKRFWGSMMQWAVGTLFCAWPVYRACILAF